MTNSGPTAQRRPPGPGREGRAGGETGSALGTGVWAATRAAVRTATRTALWAALAICAAGVGAAGAQPDTAAEDPAATAVDAVNPVDPAAGAGAAEPSGEEIARRTNARDDGASVARTFIMELRAPRGQLRRRVSRSFRRDFPESRRSILFFEEPVSLEGTALLTYDYREAERDDDQWMYLPALRKARRVASADRGQSFLGTDFSYQDIKLETKVGVADYRWRQVGREGVDGHPCWLLEGTPVDEATAGELGYGRVLYRIDAALWIPRRIEYWTPGGDPLKTVEFRRIRDVQGVWTPLEVEARDLQNGHATRLVYEDLEYGVELRESLFTRGALRRGPP